MSNDTGPKLSVKVVDSGKERWDRVGRLYRKPGFVLPEDYRSKGVLRELLLKGDLMPSITNVLGVRNSPHLLPWYARLVAEKAVDTAQRFPNAIYDRPKSAINYLKEEPERVKEFWGEQGTRIHETCEALALGKTLDHIVLTDYEQESIDAWKAWLDKFQPEFEHLEITGFGKTKNQLNYGGTADAIMKIKDKRYATDYKCVTNETPILLADGSSIPAEDVRAGMKVVAWTKEKNLHVATVAYQGDNGKHETITLVTESGHSLEATLNHPMLASRGKSSAGYARLDNLRVGDTVYVASGWAYNPHMQSLAERWPAEAPLSPYHMGALWALAQYSGKKLNRNSSIEIPGALRPELREELKTSGFLFDEQDQLVLRPGLEELARLRNTRITMILDLINSPQLPGYLFSADSTSRTGFFAGLQEVYARHDLGMDEFLIACASPQAIKDLQQLYISSGHNIERVVTPKTEYLRIPFKAPEEILHGPRGTRIISLTRSESPRSTIAIEVEGSHTHVTNGLITHNTNRSGLHIDIALQLAAVVKFDQISPDNETLIPMPKVDGALGIHISPKGVLTQPIDAGEESFAIFSALRDVWGFHAFEGRYNTSEGVIKKAVKNPGDL